MREINMDDLIIISDAEIYYGGVLCHVLLTGSEFEQAISVKFIDGPLAGKDISADRIED